MKIDIEDHLIKAARMNRDAGEPLTIEEIAALAKDIQRQNFEAEAANKLSLVRCTNGDQILYALHEGGEGTFFGDTNNCCYIPLYMLKNHEQRIKSTAIGEVIFEAIKDLRKQRELRKQEELLNAP